MSRTVGGVARTPNGRFAVVACMATEAPLVDTSIFGTIEGQAPVFQFIHGVDGFACQDLCCRLIDQVVTALDGIVHVPLPVIFFLVA